MTQSQKVILVTGSSRGIGATLAARFAQKGYRVAINYLKSEAAAVALGKSLSNRYGSNSVLAVKADVSNRSDVRQIFDQIYDHFGCLDVLINNAGINRDMPFLKMSDENWSAVIATILTGTFICSQEFALRYAGDEGHIINIGAVTAIHGRKNGVNYCAARAGMLNLTRCMALELAPKIRVNSVTPGLINTDEVMERYQLHEPENFDRATSAIPLGRIGTPDDVFRMIDFLVSDSSYITGQNFFVDGGKLMR